MQVVSRNASDRETFSPLTVSRSTPATAGLFSRDFLQSVSSGKYGNLTGPFLDNVSERTKTSVAG